MTDTAPATDATAPLGQAAVGFTPMVWDDRKVSDMWAFFAATEASSYFAARFGRELLRQVGRHLPTSGVVADYGCGRGQLTGLLAQSHPVLAVDFTETLEKTRPALEVERHAHPITFAAPDAPDDLVRHAGSADALVFIETIEHLLDDWIDPTFAAMRDLLKPGGTIVCSTPNDEDVARAMVCCPACHTYFHRYQHMRTFTAESLAAFMEARGFETIEVRGHNLGITRPRPRLQLALKKLLKRAPPARLEPHLVYVGRKR